MIVAPSVLSADFANLSRDIRLVEKAGAEWLHVDVMDGHFVPNLTIGPLVVKSIRRVTKLLLDVHLMIENPEKYIPSFAAAGADIITIHLEAVRKPRFLIRLIRKHGCKVGFSLKPKTSAKKILAVLKDIDLVLVMTVEPGFGGQRFMPEVVPKISEIKNMIASIKKNVFIEVDGGINPETGKRVAHAGADILVAGNAIFSADNPSRMVKILKKL